MKNVAKSNVLLVVFALFGSIEAGQKPTAMADGDAKIVSLAMRSIKASLQKAEGKACIVSCKVGLRDGQQATQETTVHFSDYHKKPQAGKVTFGAKQEPVNRLVEVVYKPGYDQISLIDRDPKVPASRISARKISVDMTRVV